MNGRSTSASAGFGSVSVNGRSRVPSPPTSTTACITASRCPRTCSRRRGGGRVEEVPAVHDQRVRHPAGELLPIELAELRPLGDQDRRVGGVERLGGGSAQLDARQQLLGGALGNRVVGDHGRPLALEARGEHQARSLAHVIGVRLERQAEEGDPLPDQRAEVLGQLRDHPPLLQLVDLDHGVQELEVIAAVAGQHLEGRDILGKALRTDQSAAGDHRVAAGDLQGVDVAGEWSAVGGHHPHPGHPSVPAPIARRRDPLALTRQQIEHVIPMALRHEVESTFDLVGTADAQPMRFLGRLGRAAAAPATGKAEFSQESGYPVGKLVAHGSPLEDDAGTAVYQRP